MQSFNTNSEKRNVLMVLSEAVKSLIWHHGKWRGVWRVFLDAGTDMKSGKTVTRTCSSVE